MPHLQAEAVEAMTRAFHHMESALTPPHKVQFRDSFIFRYTNKGIHEAILQKLAKTLRAIQCLR